MAGKKSDDSDATTEHKTVCGYNCAPYDHSATTGIKGERVLAGVLYRSRENSELFKHGEIYTNSSILFIRTEEKDYESVVQWMSSAPFKTEEGKVCNDCLEAKAELSCKECDEVFCKECSSRIHSGGKRAQHELGSI